MKTYEIVIILSGKLKDNELKDVIADIKNLFGKYKGKISAESLWGLLKLAYPINKEESGQYVLWHVSLEPADINSLQKDLRVADKLLRYLIVEKPAYAKIDAPVMDRRTSHKKDDGAGKKRGYGKENLASSPAKPSGAQNTATGTPTADKTEAKSDNKAGESGESAKKLDEILEEKI